MGIRSRMMAAIAFVLVIVCALAVPIAASGVTLTAKQQLGKNLYFDRTLSEPSGQACSDCHHPTAGYADPDRTYPTSKGVVPGLFGGRNAPTSAYASLIPAFGTMGCGKMGMAGYRGGQFWDGRASTLTDQAKGPFLNPLEMNNPSKATVVRDVRASSYAPLFVQVYGTAVLANDDAAYDAAADAIAAYEGSAEINTYTSKYDAAIAGRAKLTAQESLGLSLFNGKAGCYKCHGSCAGMGGGCGRGAGMSSNGAFSHFTYHNLGVPRNASNPFYSVPAALNPLGDAWIDNGLGAVLRDRGVAGWEAQLGKHRVQTLRNIARTGPYLHNGIFASLRQVVEFYNSRNLGSFGPPEVAANVSSDVGNLGLTSSEVDAVVAFLNTLTDGYSK